MNVKFKKTIENTGVRALFSRSAYLYSYDKKTTYKTVNFDDVIWENSDIEGSIIANGEYSILCPKDSKTMFIDNINGEGLEIEDFKAFDIQLDSEFEKDYIFGYKNSVYREGTFYKDIGYFDSPNDEFVLLKEQYEGNRIIWISKENIVFLKKKSIEYLDYNFDKLWDLSFDEMKIEQVLNCFDYGRFLFIISEEGKLLKVDKESGYIVDKFQHPFRGNFYQNYFVKNDQIIFLGYKMYMEISPDTLQVNKLIDFSEQNIEIKDCFFDKENDQIYYFGIDGDSFPDLIGGFDINTKSFFWKFVMKSEGKGNRFYTSPVPVGEFIVVKDGLKNVYIFEKVQDSEH